MSLLSSALPRRALAQRPVRGPRYVVMLYFSGGLDAIYTTDPKTRSDVESWVDVPYSPNEIVSAGDLALGPHLASLTKWAPQLAIVNGVQVRTANHFTGVTNFLRMKTGSTVTTPGILDVIGSHREGQPLGSIALGGMPYIAPRDHTPGWFGTRNDFKADQPDEYMKTVFDYLDETSPSEFAQMSHVLRRQAKQLAAGRGAGPREVTVEHMEQTAALFERLPKATPFKAEIWSSNPTWQTVATDLQRLAWALENDLTSGAFLRTHALDWDSHAFNTKRQKENTTNFVPLIARFLGELEKRRNDHGTLLDNTLIVAGSELGRFPRLNDSQGKDHLPEAPYLFFGHGINSKKNGAVYGRSGRKMEALRVSLKTGKDVSTGGHEMILDDVGTTLLHMTGIQDPSLYGYNGRVLEFLTQDA